VQETLKRLHSATVNALGVDPLSTLKRVRAIPGFLTDLASFSQAADHGRESLRPRLGRLIPCLADKGASAGSLRGHYFQQDLWAARLIYARHPERHVDIGSRIDGFVAHVLTFMPVTVVDLRPLNEQIDGLTFLRQDATRLEDVESNSIASLSSLSAVEHFGLGRYGDRIDPDACFVAMRTLERVLARGGRLYLSVPIGVERVEFNAHRVFSPVTILETLSDLRLESFAAIDDAGSLNVVASPTAYLTANFACGLFEFSKPQH
jgi:hypothetical protein